METEVVKPGLVEEIARHGSENPNGLGDVSFASKFCHFFVSASYPIYDSFVCTALKQLIPAEERRKKQIKLEPYSKFYDTCLLMAELSDPAGCKITMQQLDRYLWLLGQLIKAPSQKSATGLRMKSNPRTRFEGCLEATPIWSAI